MQALVLRRSVFAAVLLSFLVFHPTRVQAGFWDDPLGSAAKFIGDHKAAIGAALLVGVGVVAIATGVGAPLGAALIYGGVAGLGAGLSTDHFLGGGSGGDGSPGPIASGPGGGGYVPGAGNNDYWNNAGNGNGPGVDLNTQRDPANPGGAFPIGGGSPSGSNQGGGPNAGGALSGSPALGGSGAGGVPGAPGAAPGGDFAALTPNAEGGFFKAPVGRTGNQGLRDNLRKAGMSGPDGGAAVRMTPVGTIKHKPTGAEGAGKGGSGPSSGKASSAGSASPGFSGGFGGGAGGGQGVSPMGGASPKAQAGGKPLSAAEQGQIPLDGIGAESPDGDQASASEDPEEGKAAPRENPLSKTVALMRNQDGMKEDVGSLVSTALKMIEMRDWASAISALDRAIELSPDNAMLYVYRATAQSLSGNYAAAELDARKAIELDPRNAPAHEALAWSLLRQGRYQEAVDAASRAIQLDPQAAMPWAIRAYAKQMLGDKKGMLDDIRQAAERDERFRPQYMAALRGGKIYDPAVDDASYLLGQRWGRKTGAGRRSYSGMILGLFLVLLASLAVLWTVIVQRAKKEGKKIDLDFLLKGMRQSRAGGKALAGK